MQLRLRTHAAPPLNACSSSVDPLQLHHSHLQLCAAGRIVAPPANACSQYRHRSVARSTTSHRMQLRRPAACSTSDHPSAPPATAWSTAACRMQLRHLSMEALPPTNGSMAGNTLQHRCAPMVAPPPRYGSTAAPMVTPPPCYGSTACSIAAPPHVAPLPTAPRNTGGPC